MILRGYHPDPSAPATLINLGRFLEAEEALIINISMSPTHLAVIAALKDNWVPRFQRIMHPGWRSQSEEDISNSAQETGRASKEEAEVGQAGSVSEEAKREVIDWN